MALRLEQEQQKILLFDIKLPYSLNFIKKAGSNLDILCKDSFNKSPVNSEKFFLHARNNVSKH